MEINIYIDSLKEVFGSYLDKMKNFEFFLNPLFWVFLLTALLILLRFWKPKKAFSFCSIIGIGSLCAAELIEFAPNLVVEPFAPFVIFIIKALYFFITVMIVLYYAVIKL